VAKPSPAPGQGGRRARGERQPLRELKGRTESSGVPDLDKLIHERVRLAIVSALAATDSLGFNELKKLIGTTDGNLSVHARKLEDAGYLLCAKRFEGRVPKTEFSLTAAGRRALERYIDHMEALIRAVRDR
jgi:DNA-binding transcriptional ArsR family regulator